MILIVAIEVTHGTAIIVTNNTNDLPVQLIYLMKFNTSETQKSIVSAELPDFFLKPPTGMLTSRLNGIIFPITKLTIMPLLAQTRG
jgi:hypothetical protein